MNKMIEEFEGITAGYRADENGHWRFCNEKDREKYENFGREFALSPDRMIRIHQAHTDKILIADESHGGMGISAEWDGADYDAVITDCRKLMLCVVTADCTPVYIYDPAKKVIALVHSGRMGTMLKITGKTVSAMHDRFGSEPSDLKCVLGPYMCALHHIIQKKDIDILPEDISREWLEQWIEISERDCHVDMGKGIRIALEESGVMPENILDLNVCTYENKELYSWRRDHISAAHNLSFMML